MDLPVLAPRIIAGGSSTPTDSSQAQGPARVYSSSEWAAMYPVLQRLYLLERRKLRHIVQFMEEEHGFVATEQMYKKRFAKWGFYKNIKRSGQDETSLVNTGPLARHRCRYAYAAATAGSIPPTPGTTQSDSLVQLLMFSLRTWSHSFFESAQIARSSLASSREQESHLSAELPSLEAKEMSYALKLVTDLLARGKGALAGRVARKAFTKVEPMLDLEGPALAWNLLEMMYSLVKAREVRLFQMLLAHLMNVARDKLPSTHPLPNILRAVKGLVFTEAEPKHSPLGSTSSQMQSSPSVSANASNRASHPSTTPRISDVSVPLLQRAWTLNAEELFVHFHPSLLYLYFRMNWDACVLDLTATVPDTAKVVISILSARKMRLLSRDKTAAGTSATPSAAETDAASSFSSSVPTPAAALWPEEDDLGHRNVEQFTPRKFTSSLPDYAVVRATTIEALRECVRRLKNSSSSIRGPNSTDPRLTASAQQVMALLLSAEIFEAEQPVATLSRLAAQGQAEVPRIHAAHTACMMKRLMLLGVSDDYQQSVDTDISDPSVHRQGYHSMTDIERARLVVALQQYAHGATDPQVMREMWTWEEAHKAAGEDGEAGIVRQEIFRRVEVYVQDIPVDSI